MNSKYTFFLLLTLGFSSFNIIKATQKYASKVTKEQWLTESFNRIYFLENKGQIMQIDEQPATNISHVLQQKNVNIYLFRNGGIAYQFNRIHYPEVFSESLLENKSPKKMSQIEEIQENIKLETYRMDMQLVGANTNPIIISEGKSPDYSHYYKYNALFVHHYQRVTYKDVYPGIDWVIYITPEGNMKYDFILQPYANPSQIKIRFTNQEELYLDNMGNLIHGNRMGRFTEKAPVSFQNDKQIPSRFLLNDNILSFELKNYEPSLPLRIDPTRIWATYYGDISNDYSYSCATDKNGNIYLAGSTYSLLNIATSGSHQEQPANFSLDAFLVKFNSSGVRHWATYYGGNGQDAAYSCATTGTLIAVSGETSSTNAISTLGAHQISLGGDKDAFLVIFNDSGVRQWATYYGGTAKDIGYSCTIARGNVYLAGQTYSEKSVAYGGHQNSWGAGAPGGDAFLVQFDIIGIRKWATYYGGGAIECGYSCAVDANDYVYLTGYSSGSYQSNVIATVGSHQSTFGGGQDAFLVKFNSAGVRQWGTFYGGSKDDGAYSCTVDGVGNVFIAGYTSATNVVNSYSTLLVKFNSSGVRQWETKYGGLKDDYGYSCATDLDGNVFLAGYTNSNDQIPTAGSHQMTSGGGQDAFLAKFNSSGVRQWGTFYGGTKDDYGNSCAVDALGNVYLAGYTMSTNAIASNGHQNSNNGNGTNDAFLVKFVKCEVDSPRLLTTCVNKQLNTPLTYSCWGASSIGTPINLPPGLTASFTANTISINGIPTTPGNYLFGIPLYGTECNNVYAYGRIIVNANASFSLSSDFGTDSQTVIVDSVMSDITYSTNGVKEIGSPVNLPPGVSTNFINNQVIISGTPTVVGKFNYYIPLIGYCDSLSVNGIITVTTSSGLSNSHISKSKWLIYPNPTQGNFIIFNSSKGVFDLMDITGKTLHVFFSSQKNEIFVNVNLSAGTYFIRERLSGIVKKLIVD